MLLKGWLASRTPEAGRASARQHHRKGAEPASSHIACVHGRMARAWERGATRLEAIRLRVRNPTYCVQHIHLYYCNLHYDRYAHMCVEVIRLHPAESSESASFIRHPYRPFRAGPLATSRFGRIKFEIDEVGWVVA